MAPKLIYFPMNGRGGAIRQAFKVANMDFEDVHVTYEELQKTKAEYTFGKLPVLILEDGTQVSQSTAILRWVGRQGNLYPTEATQALLVDEVMDVLEDVITLFIPTFHMGDEEEKKAKQMEIVEGPLVPFLQGLESLASRQANGHFVGPSTTVADIKTSSVLQLLSPAGFLPQVELASLLAPYPNLMKITNEHK